MTNMVHPVVATGSIRKMAQFTIGEASKRSGVIVETIRYYEREGVVPAAARTASGRRVYSRRDVAHLRFVKRCRALGFSLNDIKALLGLALDDAPHCAEARAIGENNLELVRAKIADLNSLETTIEALVAHCTDGQAECPMLDDLLSEK
ncbi:MAG: helix-turn-helix domain-containing protein [Paracoccaceae bacterium]|nr:helix-turn-helix domain-containing protein [Paracoccaceae bacterium]